MPSPGNAGQPGQRWEPVYLEPAAAGYPAPLTAFLGQHAPAQVAAVGALELLARTPVALLCSSRCPGHLILQTYDLAERLRTASLAVIGGFHTPLEQACLTPLLRGPGPVIVCLARGLAGMRVPVAYRQPLAGGRLLLLSPFAGDERRVTAELALARNRVVAALADRIVVAHAAPGSKTERLCRAVIGWGKPVFTLASPANAHLLALGAQPLTPETAVARLTAPPSP